MNRDPREQPSRKTGNTGKQDHRESSGIRTPPRSIILAKDAEGAKKSAQCPKLLGELGALCERSSPDSSSWAVPDGNVSNDPENRTGQH